MMSSVKGTKKIKDRFRLPPPHGLVYLNPVVIDPRPEHLGKRNNAMTNIPRACPTIWSTSSGENRIGASFSGRGTPCAALHKNCGRERKLKGRLQSWEEAANSTAVALTFLTHKTMERMLHHTPSWTVFHGSDTAESHENTMKKFRLNLWKRDLKESQSALPGSFPAGKDGAVAFPPFRLSHDKKMDLSVHTQDRPYWDKPGDVHYDKAPGHPKDVRRDETHGEVNCSDEPVRIEVEVDHTLYGISGEDETCGNYLGESVVSSMMRRKARSKCNCFECNPDMAGRGESSAANIFQCDLCKKCFTKCKYFRRHRGLHNKTKTLKCDLCQISFMFSYQLQSHRLTHTHGQKPFQCGICRKSFTSKYYLKQHEWVHNPMTPFKCGICGKGYSSEGYFKRHELTHLQ